VRQGIRDSGVDVLLGLHGALHDGVMGLERVNVVLFALEGCLGIAHWLHPLAQAVVAHEANDLTGVLLLGVHPASHLVEGLGPALRRQFVDLNHSLRDSGDGFADFGDQLGVVEDAAGHLAVASQQLEHKVQSALLLDVIVLESAAVLELLASEDQTLLIRGDALLVLDLGLDGVDGVGALNLEGDGFACECL